MLGSVLRLVGEVGEPFVARLDEDAREDKRRERGDGASTEGLSGVGRYPTQLQSARVVPIQVAAREHRSDRRRGHDVRQVSAFDDLAQNTLTG